MTTPTPHDALFKAVFSQVEEARGEIVTMFPAEVLARLDLDTLKRESGSYITPELNDRHSDLLFSARFRGGDERALIYVLMEHQSQPDRFMPYRLLEYMLRIWAKHVADPSTKHLPFILPLVVHHGDRGWTAAKQMEDLFRLDLIPGGKEFIPSFRFALDDLALVDSASLLQRSMTALGRLTLLFLRSVRRGQELPRDADQWVSLLVEVFRGPNGKARNAWLMRYYAGVNAEDFARVKAPIRRLVGRELEQEMMTFDEVMDAHVEARGEMIGLRASIFAVLAARGLEPSAEQTATIRACEDKSTLLAWAGRAATAPSVADMLGLQAERTRSAGEFVQKPTDMPPTSGS